MQVQDLVVYGMVGSAAGIVLIRIVRWCLAKRFTAATPVCGNCDHRKNCGK